MSRTAFGIGVGRGAAATAITVALILIVMASPAAILSTTEAFAASKKDCKDLQFQPLRPIGTVSKDSVITIGTSQDG